MQEATEKDVDIAVSVARKTFEETWRKVTPEQRSRYLLKLADLFERDLDTLAAIEALDNGKAFSMAKVDIGMCAGCLRYYGGWADKIEGKVIDTNSETFNYTKQEPVGFLFLPQANAIFARLNSFLDRCRWPDHSMELPLTHVGLEDWPRRRLWQHRRPEVC